MPTATTTDQRPDVNEMIVVHRVFRREFRAIPQLVRGVRDGDAARARVVADHLRLIMAGLHMHHTGEDELLWPLLLERARPSTELIETMQRQHAGVDAYAGQIEPLTAAWTADPSAVRGEQLARLVDRFREALLEHLDLEEREILPLVARHITVREWQSLAQHGASSMSNRQKPLMFGAVFEDADPGERSRLLAGLPVPVRVLVRTLGGRQYVRYITRVRAA